MICTVDLQLLIAKQKHLLLVAVMAEEVDVVIAKVH